jgi:hypothetical protein
VVQAAVGCAVTSRMCRLMAVGGAENGNRE